MKTIRRTTLLILALALLFAAARGEGWQAAEDNIPRFRTLLRLLRASCEEPYQLDDAAADAVLEEIRKQSADDYDVGLAITEHWKETVLSKSYRMYVYHGGKTAEELERSAPEFSEKHALVVLGYQLNNGGMQKELVGRCKAAAAAARSFPDAILVCAGGVTGQNNPEFHSEAGEMKKYLTEKCGIDPERIFTDETSMTTLENAVNTLRILEEQDIRTMTIITSDYHQRWGQILFNAVAAMNGTGTGRRIRIVGNYNYPAEPVRSWRAGCRTALSQLSELLGKSGSGR